MTTTLGAAQGNLNPLLYHLAASALRQNSAIDAFHDVTPQTSGVALCDVALPSMCNNSTPAPAGLPGGLAGYPLTTGYDLAMGLGSVNVIGLLTAATTSISSGQAPIGVFISSNPGSINTSQTTRFFASLGPAAAGPITGTVQFLSNGVAIGSPVPVDLQSAFSDPIGFPALGTYTINAVYSGDSNYAPAPPRPYHWSSQPLPPRRPRSPSLRPQLPWVAVMLSPLPSRPPPHPRRPCSATSSSTRDRSASSVLSH